MKISVFGTGYVGLVTGVCFAEMGNDVICADIDANRISLLQNGTSPIYEPGLDDLIAQNVKGGRLQFTTDLGWAVHQSDLLFIAVGTPPAPDGSAELKYVFQVAEDIGREMSNYKIIINKSTVPMGTQKMVTQRIQQILDQRKVNLNFDVVSNPEFLREGTAIEDCLKPARVVVGCDNDRPADFMRKLYEPFLKNGKPLLVMDPLSSEMTKYAANAMLATKISLMNEFSRVCAKVGADIEAVRKGIGSDPRIGPQFIFPGVGYGGSCFPKDVQSLIHIGQTLDQDLKILKSVEETNVIQRKIFFEIIKSACSGSLFGKKIAIWGVAFKPGTDDIREAPALYVIKDLIDEGAQLFIFDAVAGQNAKEFFGDHKNLEYAKDQYQAIEGCEALVLITEWKSFRNPDFERIKSLMKHPTICDGRNLYNPKDLKNAGFNYYSIGRPVVRNL